VSAPSTPHTYVVQGPTAASFFGFLLSRQHDQPRVRVRVRVRVRIRVRVRVGVRVGVRVRVGDPRFGISLWISLLCFESHP